MLAERLATCRSVALDSSVLIYYFEEHPRHVESLRSLFERIDRGELEAVSSSVALLEVLVHPLRHGRRDLAETYASALTRAAHFQLVPVDYRVARRAAELRAVRASLRTPDAIHLATAELHAADLFLTNDARLRDAARIEAWVLEDRSP
ncbi:MAG: PIN domain-containing protein [Planctomycetes bacterium]|nr:PIN domain-containing protein [Planctomycetota bacterium]